MELYNASHRNLNTHDGALEHLANHLNILGLDRRKIAWLVKEPSIFKKGTMSNEQACDLVVGYNQPYRHVDLIELKHGTEMRGKAKHQMQNTENHLTDHWMYPVENKYLVVYPSFEYEVFP